ncbi:MAG: hypothetical protein AAF805_02965 [Planctomycetota bacterium]
MSPTRVTLFADPGFQGSHVVYTATGRAVQVIDKRTWLRRQLGSLVLEAPVGSRVRLVREDGHTAILTGAGGPLFLDYDVVAGRDIDQGIGLIGWPE